jgi:hypothetical protein
MPCGRAFLYIGALLGNLKGVRLSGLLREMNSNLSPFLNPEAIQVLNLSEALASLRQIYPGFFFLDPKDNRKLSGGGGPYGTLLKEQGSFNSI